LHATLANDSADAVTLQQQWHMLGKAKARRSSHSRDIVHPWRWFADRRRAVKGHVAAMADVEGWFESTLKDLLIQGPQLAAAAPRVRAFPSLRKGPHPCAHTSRPQNPAQTR